MTVRELLARHEHVAEEQREAFREELSRAACSGDVRALFALGHILVGMGERRSSSCRRGFQLMRRACRGGEPELLSCYADLLRRMDDIAPARVRELYLFCYRQRDSATAELHNLLGLLYLTGSGCRQNARKAYRCIARAAERGLPVAVVNLERLETIAADPAVLRRFNRGLHALNAGGVDEIPVLDAEDRMCETRRVQECNSNAC